jgi:hypothetical protein
MSNKKRTSNFLERRRLEAHIYLREFFGSKPRTAGDILGLLIAPFAIAGAVAFVIAMPSWPIRHNAANMAHRTVRMTVEEVHWARPSARGGFEMSQLAAFRIEGTKVDWSVPLSVQAGDKITVTYAIDTDGRVLIVKVAPL